ncbi:hypothetical protein ABIB25_004564 [Nakamurella sp. UYEF19]|uniref:hypothetical protein n=1 Tax=Nakamurella sp. UYEF19 TaxID=1756392 RepID=UPI003399F885
MSEPPAPRRPGALAQILIIIAVRAIPRDRRDRYEDEFRADLWLLTPRGQLVHAVSVLAGIIRLRRSLKENAMRSISNWRCRIGLHHYVVVSDDNAENQKAFHLECTRCLKLKDTKEYEPSDGKYMSGGTIPL